MISSNNDSDILVVKDLSVDFGPQIGLDKISFRVKRGDIHAVLGHHGSGKTTLIKAISGSIPRTSGDIIFEGHLLKKHNPSKAIKLGIETIHQELNIYPHWNIYDNIFLKHRIKKNMFMYDRKSMHKMALNVLNELSAELDLETPVMYYDFPKQQMIQIAKSICFPSKLLLVDELSMKLLPEDLEKIQYFLSVLRQRGTTILYATHNMDEIFNFASKVTILKNGRVVETANISDIDKMQLVQLTYSFISRRRELERNNFELYYLKNFYESVVNNIPLPVIVADTKGKIITLNTQMVDYFKIDQKDYMGYFYNDLLNLDRKTMEVLHSKILNGEDAFFRDLKFKSIRYNLHILPFYDEDGSFIGILGLIKDGKGNKTDSPMEESFINIKTPEKLRAYVAHEIKNPLSIILNYLKLIKSEKETKKILKHTLNIEKEVKRIKNIVDNLLKNVAYQNTEPEEVYLEPVINEVIDLLKDSIVQNRIEVKLNLSEPLYLKIDINLLKQVLTNFVINSVEAMPDGGILQIVTGKKDLGKRLYNIIEINDNGVGIEKQNLAKVFEPFYSTKRDRENRGLGLSISRDIINQFGGFIDVKSTPGKSTTFIIFLPCF